MKDSDKGFVVFVIVAMVAFSTLAWAWTIVMNNEVAAPSGRRWPVTTGMVLPLVTIIDENGYYANLACTVTSFNNEAHSYNLACGDAPAYITVNHK